MDKSSMKQVGPPTLLDYFAMAALTGIYAAHRDTAEPAAGGHVAHEEARMAYEAAEAMLKERVKHTS